MSINSGSISFLDVRNELGPLAGTFSCKAWVSFNAAGNAINGSGNISSFSRSGLNYLVNFTNAMTDTNYSVVASSGTCPSVYAIPTATNYFTCFGYYVNGDQCSTMSLNAAVFR